MEFVKFVVGAVAALAACFGLLVLIVWGLESWACTQPIGRPTKMMGATCFVQTESGRWVTFSSYVKLHNVNVEEK
jgi:hypothetical protein